jgi:hypothetical protein
MLVCAQESRGEPARHPGRVALPLPGSEPMPSDRRHARGAQIWAAAIIGLAFLCAAVNAITFVLSQAVATIR